MNNIENKAREYAEEQISDMDFTNEYERTCELTNHKIDFLAGAAYALDNQWRDAEKEKPEHLQPCLCYNKFVGGLRIYVYDDISKYWCTQSTYEHDPDGDNHVVDYADRDVTHWMPLNWLPIPEYKPKGGEKNV